MWFSVSFGVDALGAELTLPTVVCPCVFESTLILKGVPMKNNMQNNRLTDDKIDTAWSVRRRSFLKLLSGSVLGAVGVVAGIGRIERAEANQFGIKRENKNQFEPLWKSAQIFIGNSPTEQIPSPIIECPLFFENGHFANTVLKVCF
jgi:hypothetical protein